MLQTLLQWYSTHGRDLPWRKTDDPYRLFISEMMLQQTQVDRVIDFYLAWILRFPTWQVLATSKTADVLKAWSGLGYNRRALYIQEAAKVVVLQKRIPENEEEWRKLKGVGPYAAASLAAFINDIPTIVVDTNIRRVIGRAFLRLTNAELTDDDRVRQRLKKELKSIEWTSDIYQALMDLGAMVCTANDPYCDQCPWNSTCSLPHPKLKPRSKKKISTETIHDGKKFPDRIYRGRILQHVMKHPGSTIESCFPFCEPTGTSQDAEWMNNLIVRLVRDGLIIKKNKKLFLPKN